MFTRDRLLTHVVECLQGIVCWPHVVECLQGIVCWPDVVECLQGIVCWPDVVECLQHVQRSTIVPSYGECCWVQTVEERAWPWKRLNVNTNDWAARSCCKFPTDDDSSIAVEQLSADRRQNRYLDSADKDSSGPGLTAWSPIPDGPSPVYLSGRSSECLHARRSCTLSARMPVPLHALFCILFYVYSIFRNGHFL